MAQRKTTERHAHKAKALKFNDCMKQVTVLWLEVEKWIPDLISLRGKETGLCPVSHECLYQWIWAFKHGNKRLHSSCDCSKNSVMGIEGIKRIQTRFSRFHHQSRLHRETYPLYTLTFDNDKAFVKHWAIGKALGLTTTFTSPYTSQDKGTLEN